MASKPSTDWPPLILLGERNLPAFPVDALPQPFADYVRELAEWTQTPVELGAMLSLSVLSLATAGRLEVRAGHRECLSIYTVTAMRPGTRKSAVFNAVSAPIRDFESATRHAQATDLETARSDRRILEATRERLERQSAAPNGLDAEERSKLAKVRDDLGAHAPPAPFRLLAEDATPEQLSTLLAEQRGSLGVFSDEGGGVFENIAGRYSGNRAPSFEVYLKGHDGGSLRIDRRGRAEDVPRAVLSIGLATQPGSLASLGRNSTQRARGLSARFLYALPRDTLGARRSESTPVLPAVEDAYKQRMLSLLTGSEKRSGSPNVLTLKLDPAAMYELRDFRGWLEPKLSEHGELGWLSDWAGKLPGAVLRIAALLHAGDSGSVEVAAISPIGLEVMQRAISVGQFLISHAKAAFVAMDADPETADARKVLGWVQSRGRESFSQAEAAEGLKGWLPQASAVLSPLRMLEARGYIRRLATPLREPGRPGRPPSPVFEVNPLTLAENPKNPENPQPRIDSPDCPDFPREDVASVVRE